MLVLTRKVSEVVVLVVPPSDKSITIEVCLVRLNPPAVRLGFEAPQTVKITRKELFSPAELQAMNLVVTETTETPGQ